MTSKTLLELEAGDCRWPLEFSEDGDQLFCAEESLRGKSYCRCHYERSRLVLRKPVKILEPTEPKYETVWMMLAAE